MAKLLLHWSYVIDPLISLLILSFLFNGIINFELLLSIWEVLKIFNDVFTLIILLFIVDDDKVLFEISLEIITSLSDISFPNIILLSSLEFSFSKIVSLSNLILLKLASLTLIDIPDNSLNIHSLDDPIIFILLNVHVLLLKSNNPSYFNWLFAYSFPKP